MKGGIYTIFLLASIRIPGFRTLTLSFLSPTNRGKPASSSDIP